MTKILIIDDDADTVERLTLVLVRDDYEIVTRSTTDNLVETVKMVHPDLIILEIMFPDNPQAGFIAARALSKSKELNHIPVLLLTGVNNQNDLVFNFTENDISDDFMPVHGFLDKPIEPRALLRKIAELLS